MIVGGGPRTRAAEMTGMRALSLLGSFLALWAGTAMLLSRLPWFRDSVSLAERLAPLRAQR